MFAQANWLATFNVEHGLQPSAGMRRHIAVQILAQTDADQRRSGRPIFTTPLTTGSGGYAIQRWCARALPDQHYYYRIAAHDERDPQIGDDATLTIEPSPIA